MAKCDLSKLEEAQEDLCNAIALVRVIAQASPELDNAVLVSSIYGALKALDAVYESVDLAIAHHANSTTEVCHG